MKTLNGSDNMLFYLHLTAKPVQKAQHKTSKRRNYQLPFPKLKNTRVIHTIYRRYPICDINGPKRAPIWYQNEKTRTQYGDRNNYNTADLLHNVIRVCNDWMELK